jgi:AcrR family transcriptional regulator
MSAAPMEPPRRIGRPRASPRSATGDPSDEILAVASRLFGRDGVGSTTMSQIAIEAGLKQSSLYYYFRNKEEVLAAIVARANVVPLEWLDAIEREGGAPEVQLYRFVRGDVMALCALPFDINEVHRVAARDRHQFERYWKERRALLRRIGAIVNEGIESGSLREVPADLTALTIMSNDEAVQNWYRVDRKPAKSARAIGGFVADLTVGGLLTGRGRLVGVREKADRADFRGPIETISPVQGGETQR